jgi:pimeloyl-ACP methyl ester carboxylesterase
MQVHWPVAVGWGRCRSVRLLHFAAAPSTGALRRSPASALYRMAPLLGWTSLPWLRAIRQPTLIVSGDDDPVTPPINHRIMAALIPNAQFRTVKGGGHLMLIDSPARVAPVINGGQV